MAARAVTPVAWLRYAQQAMMMEAKHSEIGAGISDDDA